MSASNKKQQTKKALLEALEQSLGVVTTACKKVGIDRVTYYRYIKDDEEFKDKVDDLQNIALDFAESQLHKQIKEGSTAATIFFLKTKGKNRGYVEKSEQDITLNGTSSIDLSTWLEKEDE